MRNPTVLQPNWPAEFLANDLAPDHCSDVLAGSYDVPFEPKMPPVILDLGANVGAFARWASVRWPQCTIYCYEPHPKNFEMLLKTCAGLDATVHCEQLAVLNKADTMELVAGEYNCGEHTLFSGSSAGRKSVLVTVIDAATLPRADILKIDTEGAELAILKSLNDAGRLLEFSAIMLEYHLDVLLALITQLLTKAGFEVVDIKVHGQHRGEMKFMRNDVLASAQSL